MYLNKNRNESKQTLISIKVSLFIKNSIYLIFRPINILITIFLIGFGNYSFSEVLEEHLKAIESPEGRDALKGEWIYITETETQKPHARHKTYIEKNPKINNDRIHLTYKIKTNIIYDVIITGRPRGCRWSRCYTEDINIIEYKMDCLALEYQDIRHWSFTFDTYPNQISGGRPSMQRGLYFGEKSVPVKSWSKIKENSIHKAIAETLCKKVLPLRNSEK